MLQLERVPICNCIYVKGLMCEETLELTTVIQLYFESEKRSGGGDVSTVERIGKDEVLVYFEDHSSKKRVLALKLLIFIHTGINSKLQQPPSKGNPNHKFFSDPFW